MNSFDGSRTLPPVQGDPDLEAEQLLLIRASQDTDAFADLYRLHVGAVHAYAHRGCGSSVVADEVTFAVFEQALKGIAKFEWRGSGVRPWLFGVAANEIVNYYRRQERALGEQAQRVMRELVDHDVVIVGDSNEFERENVRGLLLKEMRQSLLTLHPRYQKAITLRYLAGLSSYEAAIVLQCSKPVFAVTLHRALSALRRSMESTN